jgi:hypothetical protein
MNMKTRLYSIAAAAAIALFSAGCSTNPSSAQIGTGVGAVAGGVVGMPCSAARWAPWAVQPPVH